MNQAKPDSWKNQPMPEQNSVLVFSAEFTANEFVKISLGHIPKDMDDKWFIFLDNDQLNFHRSWTGHCIYKIEFSRNGEKYRAWRAIVNRHPEQYKQTDDRYDSKLLGKSEPFPVPPNIPKDTPKGAYQHNVAGTGYPEVSEGRRQWWKFWK
jgi:hypothetical protein